jgi:hypothetical protein
MCYGEFSPSHPFCGNAYSVECCFCQVPDPMVNPNHMPDCPMARLQPGWWEETARMGWGVGGARMQTERHP